jgi:hypothetical protein
VEVDRELSVVRFLGGVTDKILMLLISPLIALILGEKTADWCKPLL